RGDVRWLKKYQNFDEFCSFIKLFIYNDENSGKRVEGIIDFVNSHLNNLNSEDIPSSRSFIVNLNLLLKHGSYEAKQEVMNIIKSLHADINMNLKILERLEKEHQELDVLIDNFF
ncbi:hypothetical protein MOF14_21600, partial [Bacillus spizizenii]|nr:hypothetical protein [Bacillus spizizenii]